MTTNTVQEGSLNDSNRVSDPPDERSDARRDAGALLQTCCPDCLTLFEVPPELLVARDSRVRCGECLVIFDALVNLHDDESAANKQKAIRVAADTDPGKSARKAAAETVQESGLSAKDKDSAEASEANTTDETGEIHEVTEATAIGEGGEVIEVSAVDEIGESGDVDDVDDKDETQLVDVDESLLDLTYTDSDLFSGEAGLPEVVYYDHTSDSINYGSDDPDTEEAFNESLFGHESAAQRGNASPRVTQRSRSRNQAVPDEVPQDPVDFNYRNGSEGAAKVLIPEPPVTSQVVVGKEYSKRRRSSRSRRSATLNRWVIRSALAFLALVIVTGLYAYRNFHEVSKDTAMRPVLSGICSLIGCELRPLVDLDALKVLERSVFSHPTIENALVIDLTFINEAEFDQPYPVLEIKLTDRTGAIVEQNRVTPADYLDQWREEDLLIRDQRLDLSLTVDDPGQRASSFELNFR